MLRNPSLDILSTSGLLNPRYPVASHGIMQFGIASHSGLHTWHQVDTFWPGSLLKWIQIDYQFLPYLLHNRCSVESFSWYSSLFFQMIINSLHQKKVYTCGKAKYSKLKGCTTPTIKLDPRGGAQVAHPCILGIGRTPPPRGWTNSMVGLAHPYFSSGPPWFWVFSSTKVLPSFGRDCTLIHSSSSLNVYMRTLKSPDTLTSLSVCTLTKTNHLWFLDISPVTTWTKTCVINPFSVYRLS